MKKFYVNAFVFSIITLSLAAQTDFKKGYIVKLNGDTLHGLIDNRSESKNYGECSFKRFNIALPYTYKPFKIKAYGIDNGRQYLSAIVNGKPVFIEYLVKGKVSLLLAKKRFYLMDSIGTLVELKNGKITDRSNDKAYNDLKSYLISKMPNPELFDDIAAAELESNSLISIVKEYNKFINVSYTEPLRLGMRNVIKDYSVTGNSNTKFSLVGGISINNLSSSGDVHYDYITNAKLSCISPYFGIDADVSPFRFLPQVSFRFGATLKNLSYYGFSVNNEYFYKNYNDINIDYNVVSLSACVNYRFKLFHLDILPHIGGGYNHRFNTKYYRLSQEYYSNKYFVKTYEYSDIKVSNGDIILMGGVAIKYAVSSARIITLSIDYTSGKTNLERINPTTYYTKGLQGRSSSIDISVGLSL
jgi:hypothetical protein